MAVVATLSKGYDLDYIWKQVDRGPAKDAASYYIQASESGGEPPGRWWGPGAKALGFARADILPEVLESTAISARVSREAAALTGLREGTPIVAGAGDQATRRRGRAVAALAV